MHLFRKPLLAVADQARVERFVRDRSFSQEMISRFIAGETLDEAMEAVKRLRRLGMTATLDQLGENVTNVSSARAAASAFVEMLERLAAEGFEPNISIKLTMLGLDLGDATAHDNLITILEAGRRTSGFVRIDMEDSSYVERTMRLFEAAHDEFPDEVGIVIQAYLHRARYDVERMIERRARVRLVKGAYAEPEAVAYQSRDEVDDNFRRLMALLLEQGAYPALATHDPALIEHAKQFTAEKRISADQFEFQMLYGVRRNEQTALVADGYRMRVYVPYGTEWYPYFTRRIAERPANALFVLRQIISG